MKQNYIKIIIEFWTKWQLWPKNVIAQLLLRLCFFISTLAQELAGLGLGNIGYFKTIAKAEYFKDITKSISIGLTGGAGIASKIDVCEEIASNLSGNSNLYPGDRFWLGGPLEMRGFKKKKLGPCEDGNYLGTYNVVNLETTFFKVHSGFS